MSTFIANAELLPEPFCYEGTASELPFRYHFCGWSKFERQRHYVLEA